MKRRLILVGAGLAGLLVLILVRVLPAQAQHGQIGSHLGAWEYPGAFVRTGGEAGADLSDSMANAIMTTPDSFETVLKYYKVKAGVTAEHPRPGEPFHGAPLAGASHRGSERTVVFDDSLDRPMKLRVLLREDDASVVLVAISRAEAEKETHIYVSLSRHSRR